MRISRRIFIRNAGLSAFAAPSLLAELSTFSLNHTSEPLEIHLFSKHLQFMNVKEAAQVAAELGFEGLDLTVRPKGHILPKDIEFHLPKAISDIEASGSKCVMMTTAVSDAANPMDIKVIETAAAEGIKYYRSNWFKYKEDLSMEESLDYYKDKIRGLAEVNERNKITGCYQNHSGTKVGASIWEVKKILESTLPVFFGAQYDIRHAVAEGGRSWSNGVKLLRDAIKTIVIKDFKWGKVDGKWQIINVPIGEGMVDFDAYFKLLKSLGLRPPASLHLEYPLGGAEKGRSEINVDAKIVFDAMKKDLALIQELWRDA